MTTGVLIVQSQPSSSEQLADFEDWYDNKHIPEVLAIDGFVSARRLQSLDGEAFIVIYEIEMDVESAKANLATAFAVNGVDWAATVISIGALAGLTTVVIVLVLGLTRVLFAMCRDGLLPRPLARTGQHGTPVRITLVVGVLVAITASVFTIGKLEEMVNIGTLFAFVLVSAGVIVLRRTRPDLERGFRAPVVPLLLATPKYLAGDMTLGQVMQVAAAFTSVLGALNWFTDNYVRLAEWSASARRVDELYVALELVGQRVAGGSARGTAIDVTWRRVLPAAARIVAASG